MSILSTLVTSLLYSVFIKRAFFTTSDNFLKSTGMGTIYRNGLSISNLSTSVFKLAKFNLSANLLTSTCDNLLNQFLLHN